MSSRRRGQKYSGLDPAVAVHLTNGAVRNKAAMTSKQRRDMERKRATYDMEPVVKAVVEQIAKREETSASQIAEMFLAFAVRAYLRKDFELMGALEERTRANTPRFQFDLHLPEEWQMALEAYLFEAQKPKKWGE